MQLLIYYRHYNVISSTLDLDLSVMHAALNPSTNTISMDYLTRNHRTSIGIQAIAHYARYAPIFMIYDHFLDVRSIDWKTCRTFWSWCNE